MSRYLKTLGLAFLALFALSAVAASAAQATEFFHSEKEKVIVTAANEGTGMTGAHTFEVITGVPAVACSAAKFEGTEEHNPFKSETATVTPTYSECSFGGNPATVDTITGNCHYTLYAATTETVAGKSHGNVEVSCEAGKTIDISVPALGIVIHIGNQLIAHAINYTNVGSGSTAEVTISATAEDNIVWTCTPIAICKAGLGASTGTKGTYKGLATAKGFLDESPSVTGVYHEASRQGISKGP